MGAQVALRQACPSSGPASLPRNVSQSTAATCETNLRSSLYRGHSLNSFLGCHLATSGTGSWSRALQQHLKVGSDGSGGRKNRSDNGRARARLGYPASVRGASCTQSVSNMITAVRKTHSHSFQSAPSGEERSRFCRKRREVAVHAITTDEAHETLAELEKRLDEEGGEYDEEEYYEILPDKRLVAREPLQKLLDISWLSLLEELPPHKRSRPEERVREHWRWAVEALLVHLLGDSWPQRIARLTRTGDPALYPVFFQPGTMPDFEEQISRVTQQESILTGKAHLQSKRRLEKEKGRVREKLEEQWTDTERARAGNVRSFLTEDEEERIQGFWARFEGRFGGDWRQSLKWDKEGLLWRLDGEVLQPAEELATLIYGEEWMSRAQKVHGSASWWREIQEEKGKPFWKERFKVTDTLVDYMREAGLWPHRIWMEPKDEIARIVKAGKKWPGIWTARKDLSDDDVWLALDESDKLFHREEQLKLRKYPKGILELEANLDKEPEYVERRQQHMERQIEKKEWRLGALPDAFSPLFMADGQFTTAPDEDLKAKKAAGPPLQDLRLPEMHLQPNPLRDPKGRPNDLYMFPRNRRVPKNWPPPGWEVPADELAFLKEGEEERDAVAEAAQQAISKLGLKALDVVKQTGEMSKEAQDDERWRLFLRQYHDWREANIERLDAEAKEMDSLFEKGYQSGRRRVGKWLEQPTSDPEVKGMYELPFLEPGQVYEGFVTTVDMYAGAVVAFGGVHDGYVPIFDPDWEFGNVWDIIEVGTKCIVQIVAVRDPFRFLFPVEVRFLDPDITPLLKQTKVERAKGVPIIGREGDVELEEVYFESGRKYLHGPRERAADEKLTAYDIENLSHPDQQWVHRKGVLEQRLLANEEYAMAMANGTPLPFPILYDWDYIADPKKRLEYLREFTKEDKLVDGGRSTLPRDEHKVGQLMDDNDVSLTSRVTIDSYFDRMTEKDRSNLDLEAARIERREIREEVLSWFEQSGDDWAAMDAAALNDLMDDVEQHRPRFKWEEKEFELYAQEVSYYQAKQLAQEEYDEEVKLRGLWNETPLILPEIDPPSPFKGKLTHRRTPKFRKGKMRRARPVDDDRIFPDIPTRYEEWRAENARQLAISEQEKKERDAAKAAQAAAEKRAAGRADVDGGASGEDDDEDEEADDELDVL